MQYISQKKKLIIQMNITNDEYQTCKDIQFFLHLYELYTCN